MTQNSPEEKAFLRKRFIVETVIGKFRNFSDPTTAADDHMTTEPEQ